MKLIVRADASSSIGAGHVMRCLALAQAWRDSGGTVIFLSHCESDNLRRRILDEGFGWIHMEKSHPHHSDLHKTIGILKEEKTSWLVLDGYHFDSEYQKAIKNEGFKVLLIDDMNHLPSYYADILLNQNLHAPSLNYSCDTDTNRLLGPRYVLLRREFNQSIDRETAIPEKATKILVTLGGADPQNATLKVVGALNRLKDDHLVVRIVVGPANQHVKSMQNKLAASDFSAQLLSDVKNMPELMQWADLAISAGGSSCWELCFSGTPFLVLILAENQLRVGEELKKTKVAECLGWHNEVTENAIVKALLETIHSADKRRRMSSLGMKLIDGKGAKRVVREMRVGKMRLRRAEQDDCELLWNWANDPMTRSMSFNSDYIHWDKHKSWFSTKLSDPKCSIYVALTESGEPFGQVRFDIDGGFGTVSINLAPEFRQFGMGAETIMSACRQFTSDSRIKKIRALIKKNNSASLRCFEKAKFKITGDTSSDNCPIVRMEYFQEV